MVKNNNKIKKNYKIKKNNVINDFSKKNIFQQIFSGLSIIDYKLIFYWLPILIYIFAISSIIFFTQSDSQYFIALIAGLTIFIIYFLIDLIYQNILCKNISFIKLLSNSALNALIPSIFVLAGYILTIILRDVKPCNISYNSHMTGVENTSNNYNNYNTDTTRLINIHRNNIIISIFFYIFSIIYNNPINKKKCANNKLC
tara:strand:- start:385 stop:984 length:600 start_codon:yes stop_codon:yes gene_type:complete